MESRREIFGYSTNLLHIIETRMASTHGNIHSISPFNKADTVKWFATMMSDDTPTDSAELSPCGTAMTVGPTASIIANMAVWEFINYLLNQGTATKRADIFLKPLMIDTGEINHDQIKEAVEEEVNNMPALTLLNTCDELGIKTSEVPMEELMDQLHEALVEQRMQP